MPKGIKGFQKGHKTNIGRLVSKETAKKISGSNKGRKVGEIGRKNMSIGQKGKLITLEHRKKISDALKGRIPKNVLRGDFSGEKCHLWKGGITPINQKIRTSYEYKLWRKAVFERDSYQCIWGGKEHGSKLNVDHIKPFSLFPELRFAIDNGRTLCHECHKKTDTYGSRCRTKKAKNLY